MQQRHGHDEYLGLGMNTVSWLYDQGIEVLFATKTQLANLTNPCLLPVNDLAVVNESHEHRIDKSL